MQLTQDLLSVSRDWEIAASDSNALITESDLNNNNNRKRAKVKKEEFVEENNNSGKEKKLMGHSPMEEEKEDHRKIQDNLLYLFGTKYFNPIFFFNDYQGHLFGHRRSS